jgi:predicted nucleic acid-binding protein
VIIYADSSALAKLLIQEEGSDAIGTLAAEADGVVTAAISRVETFAALAAAHLEGRLDDAAFEDAKAEAMNLFGDLSFIGIDDVLIDRACALAELHSLRAYGAVQLSALLTYGSEEITFACFDGVLKAAAAAEGYAVFPADGAADQQELIQN